MAWTTPTSVITGALMTAAFWNTQVKGNMDFLFANAPTTAVLTNPISGLSQTVQPAALSDVPLTLKGFAGQTANLQRWQNSAGTTLANVSAAGLGTFSGVTSNGDVTISDGSDVILNTTTGTRFGTATTQKLSFYNSAPIIKPTGNILTALSNLGLVATPTIAPADVTGTAVVKTDFTAKGNLLSATAPSTTTTLSVGTNTQILEADSTAASGLVWSDKLNNLTVASLMGMW